MQAGQLAFINRRPGMSLHVGIIIGNARAGWSVVHASSSRGMVVEDPLDQYLASLEQVNV